MAKNEMTVKQPDFSENHPKQGGREVSPSCTLSWTFAHANHAAIIAISASLYLDLVQLPGAICKAAEQEMRLVRGSLASPEDVLRGATR